MQEKTEFTIEYDNESQEADGLTGGDYGDFLAAFISQSIPDDAEPVSDTLLELGISYLRSLCDEIAPPSPELMEHFWGYYNSVAHPVDEIEPSLVRDQLIFQVFPVLTPLDFKPLSPEGVEGAIQKLVSNRKPRNILETLVFLLKGQKKLNDFVPPATIRLVWRKIGPFQLLAMEERMVMRSAPISDVISKSPTLSISALNITHRGPLSPLGTDAITVDLLGFSLLVTSSRLTGTLSGGLSNPVNIVGDSTGHHPISCHATVEFHPLKSRHYNMHLRSLSPQIPQGDLSNLFLTAVARVNVKFYAAIIDLGP